jgi:HPt (histidine-containing phosphotransfer) domain-containing protein
MDDYLNKPFKRADLSRALERWLAEAARGGASSAALPHDGETPPELPALDPDALTSLGAMGQDANPRFPSGAAKTYLDEAEQVMERLADALSRQEAENLTATAQAFELSSLTFGAQRVGWLCERLQALGRSGNLDQAPTLLANLRLELEQVQCALAKEYGDELPDAASA